LGDTHKLYRRNTNWDKIIENARAFIQAGGNAEWVMTIFKHNEHQIDECRTLSSQFGFKNFTSRFNDRPNLPVRDRNGKTVYFIESSVNTPLTMLQDVVLTEELMTRREEKLKQHIITTTQQKINKPLIGGKRDCGSYTNKNIYISAQWAVVPCCFIGNLMFNKETDRHYKDMLDLAAEYNVDVSNLVARDDRPVSAIVDLGFNWIYNSLPTSKALSICYRHCNSTTAAFTAGQLHIKRVNLQKPQ
jgi:MoaA/NifB/PqqE/SkfB family radical SAM enzyme